MTGASAPGLEAAARAKQAVRERVWALLERERAARVVKSNPDAPQLPVRARALADGKLLYMAVPRLADERPFIRLDPAELEVPPRRAASITGAARAGWPVAVAELRPVDLVVCGSVAVNREGARVGKGGGFSDLEFGLLVEAGLIGADTTVATTVHPVQVLEETLPETSHDFRLDLIVAGEEVIACRRTASQVHRADLAVPAIWRSGGQGGDGGDLGRVEVVPEDPRRPAGAAAADNLLAGDDQV